MLHTLMHLCRSHTADKTSGTSEGDDLPCFVVHRVDMELRGSLGFSVMIVNEVGNYRVGCKRRWHQVTQQRHVSGDQDGTDRNRKLSITAPSRISDRSDSYRLLA
jgi:hypothetical protein